MFSHALASCAGGRALAARGLSKEAYVQLGLGALLTANLLLVATSFSIENLLAPWQARMETTTPGWCFILAQAAATGLIAALAIRGGLMALAEPLLAATLLGYAYFLAGAPWIDPRRSVQLAHLMFRAVELGLVCVAAMMLGTALRLMLRQRLVIAVGQPPARPATQYCLRELMLLMLVFSIGLSAVQLFFDHVNRETQLAEIMLSIVRTLPAALPWLWGATRPQLRPAELVAIVGVTLLVMLAKAVIICWLTNDDVSAVLLAAGQRAAAYATAATLNGLLVRGLGLRWRTA